MTDNRTLPEGFPAVPGPAPMAGDEGWDWLASLRPAPGRPERAVAAPAMQTLAHRVQVVLLVSSVTVVLYIALACE